MMETFISIFNKICEDTQRGEHVDSDWIKDSFDLSGYSIITHEKITTLNETIKELEEKQLDNLIIEASRFGTEIIELREENKKLRSEKSLSHKTLEIVGENRKLREALGFYANKSNWRKQSQTNFTVCHIGDMEGDNFSRFGGKLARKTLKEIDGSKK